MKIAVNTRLLLPERHGGINAFAVHTLKRMVTAHPEHEFVFLFDRPYDEKFIFGHNVIPEVVSPPTRHPLLQYLWFNLSLPPVLKKHRPDLFYSPDGYAPLQLKNIPSLLVIHDINFHHYPASVPLADRIYMNYFFPRCARQATRLLTVSEFCKQDIAASFHVPAEKIDVTCNGPGEIFEPINDNQKSQIRRQYTGGEEYFIYIGAILPRKNIPRMIRAFELFRKNSAKKTKMVIAGKKMCLTQEVETSYRHSPFKNDILFTGELPADVLGQLLGASLALVLVSYFEGFGIPVVEAMHAGVPVIASNVTALPEIAGDAALFADPFSEASIAGAMEKIAADASLRQQLIARGHERKKLYTWEKAATLIWQSIEKTIKQTPS